MKLSILNIVVLILGFSNVVSGKTSGPASVPKNAVGVLIDLVNVKDDKVLVTVIPPQLKVFSIAYQFPKIIPGTYAIADYGRYVEQIKAFDRKGIEMKITRTDSNTVVIENATKLGKITYLVNDTFDCEDGSGTFSEKGRTIFSPAGTNIDAGKQFTLNMAGFVGYFTGLLENPYQITITHPADIYGTTALVDSDQESKTDIFLLPRYPDVVDNPIMYAKPDTASFKASGMDVLLGVYSRRGNVHASALQPDLERMMKAQKKFLGSINNTQKYAVLAYISTGSSDDAQGIGALEHNSSTSAVFREPMKSKDLIHVISHEFFHTITPLKVHSKEIQHFDFNSPKMSQHLWFYEGVTEYFSNLFQVNQGLIDQNQFYDLMAKKLENTREYDDKLSFTEMSRNILDPKIKSQYPNVYEKGALIAMCLDISIREHSQGKKGLLWLMGELSKKYGPNKPFDDAALIPVITSLTNPETGDFLRTHVEKGEPIDYDVYFAKVGLKKEIVRFPEPVVFVSQDVNYIKTDSTNTHVLADVPDDANAFYKNLGIENNDIFLEFNGLPIDANDLSSIIFLGYDLDENSPISVKVNRNGQDITLKGTVKLNYADGDGYRFTDQTKRELNESWLMH